MRRREKFLFSAFILSFGLLGTQYVPLEYRILGIILFFFGTYTVSAWALFEDLHGVEWFTIVPFPGIYAVSVSFFYYLLPENIWSKLAVLIVFGIGMYAIYLTSNIYSVAKIRTIQLLRAAQAVGFFMVLITALLFFNTLLSLHLAFWINGLMAMVIGFPLALLSIWSIELQEKIDKRLYIESLAASVLVGELAVLLSFFPGTIWTTSLYITSLLYVVLGLLTTDVSGRLFKNTVVEYAVVWAVMTATYFLLLEWK